MLATRLNRGGGGGARMGGNGQWTGGGAGTGSMTEVGSTVKLMGEHLVKDGRKEKEGIG
jgi:hypothetical protein